MSLGEYASKFEELQKYYTFFYHPYFESSQTNKPKYFGPQPNKKKYNEKKPYNLFQWKPQSVNFLKGNSNKVMNNRTRFLKCG